MDRNRVDAIRDEDTSGGETDMKPRRRKQRLPEPACPLGYTPDQVDEILGERADIFHAWMRGQTVALCDGRSFDPDTREFIITACTPGHGLITYVCDVETFLDGRPPLD